MAESDIVYAGGQKPAFYLNKSYLMKIGRRKYFFLVSRYLFSWILISKMDVKMISRIITKNHAADQEIGFLIKSITKPYERATAMPPAWDLNIKYDSLLKLILKNIIRVYF